ncbi:cell division membrane protein [Companilactobacillus paralimentarius DSM 13238 = JCM 10415]|jgi:Bacterial cell division membrane protein|uniref:Cell division membrane protein n=5 Tax=Companilactobacillus TaxID=2767879 RepID=A0ABR5NWB9_9LACO|nr:MULTISPECIES: FtsW/RodA/SpoVE family cell cycle protein [Companilactobacillus]KAE9561253.1 rod shape-determining protein RodA [Companilactobacillus kimchii]KAE9565006.1 rod shape-determining protein RodA [Companilactobacillus paralimentarius]KRK53170.1 cell division membrane protein [Companilactobacillus kimchii DSM 13961 = JCM 10707]KRK82868.1 cell division membrane protein [Companilactobacillus bobalius DSM 19674]KRL32345.1 cell division membrane protein [Companilactobacillus paralimentar
MQIRNENKKNDVDSRIDYGIIFSVMMLAMIGLMSIYVATIQDSQNPLKNVVSQIVWYAIGAVIVAVVMQFDAEQLWQVATLAYFAGLALLFLVLIFYSRSYAASTGAKSWFAIGSFTFQPSEVMKPAFILMLGKVITNHNSEYSHTIKSDFMLIGKLFLWTLPVMVLLKLQNDFGTILVFVAILGGMILVSGIDWRILLVGFLIVAVVGGTALLFATTDWGRTILGHFGFRSYQFARIDSWRDPSADTSENGYQIWQNMKAIGSGQLFGKGFNVSNVYVPVRESDMIFSVVGENFGFVGSCILILLYFLLIYQMVQVTFDTKNEFYAYVSTGVIMMILFHVFENIGMSVGLLPLTGIPLPFISQGGSALLGNMIGIGLIMSMRFHHKSYMFENGTFKQR